MGIADDEEAHDRGDLGTQGGGPADGRTYAAMIDTDAILDRLLHTAHGVLDALDALASDTISPDQADRRADETATSSLLRSGFGVWSEESGPTNWDREIRVIVDPLDGTTNLARGIPHVATSLWACDGDGGIAAIVAFFPTRRVFHAVRGGGAYEGGRRLEVHAPAPGADLLVAGPSSVADGIWSRRLGASAVELCLVAAGALDGFAPPDGEALPPWDYLAGAMIAAEAGCVVSELDGADLWDPTPDIAKRPVVAPSASSHERLRRVALHLAADHPPTP
jgi:myo-inositol-1(or 4)-monophosphatase